MRRQWLLVRTKIMMCTWCMWNWCVHPSFVCLCSCLCPYMSLLSSLYSSSSAQAEQRMRVAYRQYRDCSHESFLRPSSLRAKREKTLDDSQEKFDWGSLNSMRTHESLSHPRLACVLSSPVASENQPPLKHTSKYSLFIPSCVSAQISPDWSFLLRSSSSPSACAWNLQSRTKWKLKVLIKQLYTDSLPPFDS